MRVELQLTYRCQLRCWGCDRLCNRFPDRTEELSLDAIQRFIDQAAKRKVDKIGRVKICGGEPLLHTQLPEAYEMLLQAAESGVLGSLVMQSNGVMSPPPLRKSPLVKWKTSKAKSKTHIPYEWAPCDLDLPNAAPCSHPRRCGYAYDSKGWLLCSPGIMIARLMGMEHLYLDELPDPAMPWGMEMCGFCGYGLPEAFRHQAAKPLAEWTAEMKTPTRSWVKALARAEIITGE